MIKELPVPAAIGGAAGVERMGLNMEKGLFEALTQSLREAGQIHRGRRKPTRSFPFSSLRVKLSRRKARLDG